MFRLLAISSEWTGNHAQYRVCWIQNGSLSNFSRRGLKKKIWRNNTNHIADIIMPRLALNFSEMTKNTQNFRQRQDLM